jgi:O-antigen/teichoic acid export membrane protein
MVLINQFFTGIGQSARFVRWRSFDCSTEQGRSNERHRRVVLFALAMIVSRGSTFLVTLATVPLALNYLGPERYGLLMTVVSLNAMLMFADLGLGTGLINAVSEAHGKDDRALAREYVSSGFFMLTAIAAVAVVALVILYTFIEWARVFNVDEAALGQESAQAVAVLIACFALSLPLGIIQRIRMGYQDGFLSNLWLGAGNLFGLVALLGVIAAQVGLPWLVAAMMSGPIVGSFLSGLSLFALEKRWLWPRWRFVSARASRHLLHLGFFFLLIQLTYVVAYTSDNLIAARVLGVEAVAAYNVTLQLYNLIPMSVLIFLLPLWPAYREALARGDHPWIRRTLLRSLVGATLVSAALALILVVASKPLIRVWVSGQVEPSDGLLAGFGVWAVVWSAGNALAMFCNGMSWIRFQAVLGLLVAPLSLVLKIWLAHVGGVAGIVWATVIAFTAVVGPGYLFFLPRYLASALVRREEEAA